MDRVENEELGSGVTTPATQEPATNPSPAPDGGNEGQPIDNQEPDGNIDWKKRYSDSSREVAKKMEEIKAKEDALREKDELVRSQQEEFLGFVTKDRGTYEKFIDSKGLSPQQKEYYMNVYDAQIAPSKLVNKGVTDKMDTTPTPSAAPAVVQTPSDPVREAWMNRMDASEKEKWTNQVKATKSFFDKEENVSLPSTIKEAIKATAAMLDQEFQYSPDEALAAARKRILEPEKTKDEGYAQGVKDSYSGGVSRSFSGGAARSEETSKLPAKHEAFVLWEIQRRGLKDDAAKSFREKYAEKLASENS